MDMPRATVEDEVFCPYRGLEPFTKEDAAYFFGRARDTQLVAANLVTTRLTILYGASGVGKSSLLMAGVLPKLDEMRGVVAVYFRDWHKTFKYTLKQDICRSVWREEGGDRLDLSFPDLLADACGSSRGTVTFIFDQFEDYFYYHPDARNGASFDAEFAAAVNRRDLDANFLLCLREDGLSQLDRLEGRIPDLLGNMYRLRHLDRESAEEAIRKPLERYREQHAKPKGPVDIENKLVVELLKQCVPKAEDRPDTLEQRTPDEQAGNPSDQDLEDEIEVSILQLLLERLWHKERLDGSNIMRAGTLRTLGGRKQIIQTFVDTRLDGLSERFRKVCVELFDRLVTPSGRKLAASLDDLVRWAGDLGPDVKDIMTVLSGTEIAGNRVRMLRSLPPAWDEPGVPRYELLHDLLGPAIQSWRQRYLDREHRRDIAMQRRRRLNRMYASAVLCTAILVGIYYLVQDWLEEQPYGYVEDLSNGSIYDLSGQVTLIGRYVGEGEAPDHYVGLESKFISRFHLIVFRNLQVMDGRSTNGSMLNAEFLPYGFMQTLKDGDILSLAGEGPFRFVTASQLGFLFGEGPPAPDSIAGPNNWGIFVDGRHRKLTFLDGDAYSLFQDKVDGYLLKEGELKGALAAIRRDQSGNIKLRDNRDSNQLMVTYKESDYKYPKILLSENDELPLGDASGMASLSFQYGDLPFQIVGVNHKTD